MLPLIRTTGFAVCSSGASRLYWMTGVARSGTCRILGYTRYRSDGIGHNIIMILPRKCWSHMSTAERTTAESCFILLFFLLYSLKNADCHCQGSNPEPPDYRTGVLPLHYSGSASRTLVILPFKLLAIKSPPDGFYCSCFV